MTGHGSEHPVRLEQKSDEDRITIIVDGALFTEYRYGDPDVKKPILFPICSPTGERVTRGFPIDPRSNDRRDHPHQVGHWFTHGNVGGIDFWNNSPNLPPSRRDEVGTIRHGEVTAANETGDGAVLSVQCDWCGPDGSMLIEEATRFAFQATKDVRVVDRTTRLSAVNNAVPFRDDKEGLFGLRVARQLELQVEEDLVFVDVGGEETVVTATDDHDVTGTYFSATGARNEDAWGERAAWMALTGTIGDNEEVTVAILDHPENPGYPTHWMARPYGLFAANPLGRSAFDEEALSKDFTINPGEIATFRYRLFVWTGGVDRGTINTEHERFVAQNAPPYPSEGGESK